MCKKWQRMWRAPQARAGRCAQNAGEDVIKRMKTGGLLVGKKESQDLAWKRVLEFFKRNLG